MPVAQTRLECLQILKLLHSIRQRDTGQVEKLIANGVPELVNYTDPANGEMAISVAAANDDLEMVQHLLRLGASADAVDAKGRTAVMKAAQMGNHACVEMLVKTRTNLKIQDSEGKGILFYCMHPTEKYEKCAELAIIHGADVDNCNSKGTPLLVSACERAVALENFCLLLLSNGADPNKEDQRTKRTALMAAAFAGSTKIVKALIERGAEVNSLMTVSKTHAVHEAAKGGHILILQMFSGAGAQFDVSDNQKNNAMHFAAKGRHALACKFLAQRGCNPKTKNDHGYTARMIAKEEGSQSTAKECRRAEKSFGKSSKNGPWAIPLYDFCCLKSEQLMSSFQSLDSEEVGTVLKEEIVDILAEAKAPLPEKKQDLDKLLSAHSQEEDIDYHLFLSGKKIVDKVYRISAFSKKKKKKKKKKTKRSKKGKTKIPVSICTKREEDRGEDGGPPGAFVPRHLHTPDPRRIDEGTSLKHILSDDSRWYSNPPEKTYINLNDAIRHLDADTIQSAMHKGKEIIHWADKFFKTPIMIAALEGNVSMVTYLIECGADVNATDNFKWTALHFACRKGHLEVIEKLLQHGAKVNAVTLNGGTPIMRAIESGIPEVVQLLIDHGADLRVETRKGKNPLDLAAAYGDSRVYNIVKDKWDNLPPLSSSNAKKGKALSTTKKRKQTTS